DVDRIGEREDERENDDKRPEDAAERRQRIGDLDEHPGHLLALIVAHFEQILARVTIEFRKLECLGHSVNHASNQGSEKDSRINHRGTEMKYMDHGSH